MYDEDRIEDERAFHRHTRDTYQPDGMSAPPEPAPPAVTPPVTPPADPKQESEK